MRRQLRTTLIFERRRVDRLNRRDRRVGTRRVGRLPP
jgi:hypothetical protein